MHLEREGPEEPLVLSGLVLILKGFLDALLGFLPQCVLLEHLARDNALQCLYLEGVACGHDVVVVDGLYERFDLRPPVRLGLGHAALEL